MSSDRPWPKTALALLALWVNCAGCSKPSGESSVRVSEASAPPAALVEAGVATPNPSSTSRPCIVEGPCTSCIFPASGVECQNETRARGFVPTCSYFEDAGLGRKITVYCPPGYRAPQ